MATKRVIKGHCTANQATKKQKKGNELHMTAWTREQWIDSLDAYKSTTLVANSDVALFICTSSRLSLQVVSLPFLVCND